MQLSLPLPVASIDPDLLVSCVARIDELHTMLGHRAADSDIIVAATSEVVDYDHDLAAAAVARIRGLIITLHAEEWLTARYRGDTPAHLPPEMLTRAAAVAPLLPTGVFCVEALEQAILVLMSAKGRA